MSKSGYRKILDDVTPDKLNKLDRKSLSKIVSTLSSVANKRIKRFKEKGMESPAFISVEKSGGKFGSRGKTINQLRSEFIRVKNFLMMKTSTVKGYKKVKEDFFNRVEASIDNRIELSDSFLNRFWRVYDKTANLAPFVKGSPDRQKLVYDVMVKNREDSEEELLQKINNMFDSRYEEEQATENEFDTSRFFRVS